MSGCWAFLCFKPTEQCLPLAFQGVSGWCALPCFKPTDNVCPWLSSRWVAAISCYVLSLLTMPVLGSLCHDPSHGGSYVVEGRLLIRIGLCPRRCLRGLASWFLGRRLYISYVPIGCVSCHMSLPPAVAHVPFYPIAPWFGVVLVRTIVSWLCAWASACMVLCIPWRTVYYT